MSALVVLRDKLAAYAITDLGTFDAESRLIGQMAKIAQFPHMNAIAAIRGQALHIPTAECILAACGGNSFDELKNRISEACIELLNANAALFGYSETSYDFEIAVAGIDENGASQSFLICSHDRYGQEPFTRIDLPELAMLPGDDQAIAELAPLARQVVRCKLDVTIFARRAMEIARSKAWPDLAGKMIRQIGGGVLLTRVSRDCVSSRIIHRWPDKVGETIDPTCH